MPHIEIGTGDSIPSLARSHGFFWETLWNHAENAALKEKRSDPNLLAAGDRVFIPERTTKWEPAGTEERHRFKLLGDPVRFVLQLRRFGEPRKNEPYVLRVGRELIEGTTDGQGKLETFIPGDAKSALLLLRGGAEKTPLRISRLDPVTELSGVQQRLLNLGYDCRSESGKLDPATQNALRRFQAAQELEVTGEPDAATQAQLEKLHP